MHGDYEYMNDIQSEETIFTAGDYFIDEID